MNKYGFWVIPENTLYQELEKIIGSCSEKYQSPVFTPHMTLHGVVSSTDENVVKVTREAVKGLRPFSLEVGEVEFSSTYFQCIFARVKTNANLFNAHMALRHSFGMEEERVFMPHLSLVYGDFEMEKREKITKEIDIKNKFFEAKEITIIRADLPNPDTWEIVEQVKL